jgi:branched-chain amino acid transport system permease protein
MVDQVDVALPRSAGHPTSSPSSVADMARGVERRRDRILGHLALILLAGALLFALIGWHRGDTFFLRLATEALIYAGLALSVDLLLGYVGLLSLGQALYFGLGAYGSALVLKHVAPSFWLALGAGVGIGLFAGTIGGLIAIRARGVYFALITFGLAQVVAKIIYNTRTLGASDGIIGIPIVDIPLGVVTVRADWPVAFFLIVLGGLVLVYALLKYLTDTPFGRVLSAIRVNERRLPYLGFGTGRFKFGAFVLASTIAAVFGSLYPMLRGFVSPELIYFEVSTNAVIAVIIGGMGTLIGPILGAVLLVFGKSIVGTYTEHHLMVIGALFVASVIFLPYGIAGFLKARAAARRGEDL